MWKKESFPGIDKHMCVSEEEDQEDDDDVMSRDDNNEATSQASSSPPDSPLAPRSSIQGSFLQAPAAWPQSYRQSMDIYSSFGSPGLSTLSPNITGLGSSSLSSSYKRQNKFTEKPSSLTASFLSHKGDQEEASIHDPVPPKYASFKYTEDYHGVPGQCSTTQGTLNGINVLCGVGILTTPYALKEGGWLSLCLFFVLAVMSFYTGILLRRCLDSQAGLITYPDIGQAAFGITGRIIISIFLYMELYANCVEYLILEGDNLSAAFPSASLSVNGVGLTGKELFAIITAISVLPTVWLRDLSLLSYISAYVMAFIGSFLSMMLCLIFPASCFLKLAGKKLKLSQKAFCMAIILVGSLCCIAGTYSSLTQILSSL